VGRFSQLLRLLSTLRHPHSAQFQQRLGTGSLSHPFVRLPQTPEQAAMTGHIGTFEPEPV